MVKVTKLFVQQAIDHGGSITPLIIDPSLTKGTALFNPSIFLDGDELILNLRHCQYTIYHSEVGMFEHQFGPLVYLNPENDITLTTTNYFCRIGNDMLINDATKVDMSKFHVKPIWEFIGLEDARLVRWDGKLYLSGVRRDTTPNGTGRMELSEIEMDADGVREVSRFRIPAPQPDSSYCEKNWMPVLDMPYHYVKWSNPTEVVKVDPVLKTCETIFMGQGVPATHDYRGGSQVIPFGEYRIAILHQVDMFWSEAGRKNAVYRHLFIVWDKDWNVVRYGEPFGFMGAQIEFCCGMTEYGDDILITFGYQDNAAYLLRVGKKFIEDYINEKI